MDSASPLHLLTTQHLHPQVPPSCLWQNSLKHIPLFVEAPFLPPQRHCLSNSPLPLLHHQLFPLCWIIPISIETCNSYFWNYFQSCVTLGIVSRSFSEFLSWALGSFFSWSPSTGNPCSPPELFLWAVLFAVLFCSVNSCTALFSLNSQLCPSPWGTVWFPPLHSVAGISMQFAGQSCGAPRLFPGSQGSLSCAVFSTDWKFFVSWILSSFSGV